MRGREFMPKEDLLLGALSGAFIVVFGGLYALLFALGRLRSSRALTAGAYIAYGLLAVFSLLLLGALNLQGIWTAVILIMLAGYFLAPRAIWNLCLGTHSNANNEGARP